MICKHLQLIITWHARIYRGDRGVRTLPPEKSQIYRVSLSYWSGSPENHKATKPAFNVGHYRPASGTQFQCRFAGRPIIVRFWWFLEPRSPKKTLIRVGPPSDNLSRSLHVDMFHHYLNYFYKLKSIHFFAFSNIVYSMF